MYKYNLKSHCVDEQPEFKQPNIELYKSILGEWHSIATKDRYFSDLATYTSYIASLRSIPVSGKVEWKDGEDVTGKFRIAKSRLQFADDRQHDVAIPIKQTNMQELDEVEPYYSRLHGQPIKQEQPQPVMPVHPLSVKLFGRNSVPMSLFNEVWAQRNHGQTLKRLAERGGLGVLAMLDNIHKRSLSHRSETSEDVELLIKIINQSQEQQPIEDIELEKGVIHKAVKALIDADKIDDKFLPPSLTFYYAFSKGYKAALQQKGNNDSDAVEFTHKIGVAILKHSFEVIDTAVRKSVVEVGAIVKEFDKEGIDIITYPDF